MAMINEYNPIDPDGVDALQSLLGRDISQICCAQLHVDVAAGVVFSHGVTFWLDGRSSDFVNIRTDWRQTQMTDYHKLVVERSHRPADIRFENGVMGSVSTYSCKLGHVEKIEIIQSTFEITSLPQKSGEQALVERIQYDRVINIFGDEGCISLSTEFGPILGEITIHDHHIPCATCDDEIMVVRTELTKA